MDDVRARLERALADTHDFERELGGGGMSRTYVVLERALNRRLVVKVLAPELLAGISVERFRREVQLAAQLQHPHIVPVIATGEVDGLPWFSMPYVEGESLRARVAKGDVDTTEAVSILRDVARALAYAHEHGIVHRDIKPDNVLLSGGSATVTDFGIAKAINAARGGAEQNATLTQVGTSIGTPTYMAPEQAAGDTDTDHRADIYAFGAMAYELLAGRPPFQYTSPTRMVAAHMTEPPQDVRTFRPDLPPALADLIMACLAKSPDDRPGTARDMSRVLSSVTTSGTSAAPAFLRGGHVPLGKALSLWLVATVAVIVTAWAARDVIGLPDWVLPGSIGVMLAGLPIILITAWVQRSARRAFTETPRHTPGGTSATNHGTLATFAIKASPHVSWRRTWIGGAVAVGAFAVLVLGFMVTRALGIGPAASLRGAGTFGSSETIIVADFRSDADSSLGITVAEALRTDLAQSSQLRVLTRASVRDILRLMERPVESSVPFDLAREIATREGAKAVLDGNVTQLGQGYIVSARLVSALNGEELATFRETASSEDELITALGALSRSIRTKAGESLKTIRASSELERVTTPSLPALRKYVEGSLLADEQGDVQRGLSLLEEAVQIDTAFAMAWRKISVLLGNDRRERQRALNAASTAFRHRDRLTENERLLTEGYYYTRGPRPDHDRALTAYQEAIRLDSLSTSALNNSAVILLERRRIEEAESLYKRVTALPRSFGGAFSNLLRAQIMLGRPRAALESTQTAYTERYPTSVSLWLGDWTIEWASGNYDRADSIGDAVISDGRFPREIILAARNNGSLAALTGRFRDAQSLTDRENSITLRDRNTSSERLSVALDSAFIIGVMRENPEAARALVVRALRREPLDSMAAAERPWGRLVHTAGDFRDTALARYAINGFLRDAAPRAPDSLGAELWARSRVARAAGRWSDVLRFTEEAYSRFEIEPRGYLAAKAEAFDALERQDSALVYMQRFLDTKHPSPWDDAEFRARFLVRSGELLEAAGQPRAAMARYEQFTNLWKDADPDLQPRVREVKQRIERLRRVVG